ncbi:hypothetical protein Tco_0678365 [Tanacetum coccineum]|uniref:Uncharacterized protein n=1 Tax=Tanacetum coccineum TaxID=301880 RepID=A0ABQ4XF34_9ASTR
MSIQDMKDLKQHYLDEMLSLSNDLQIKDYHNEKIDIRFRRECESMIDELKGKFNGMSIEINIKKGLQRLEQVANLSTYPSQRFKSFCYDDDDDYDYEESSIPLRDIISELPLNASEFIVEDLFQFLSESKDTSRSDSECIESDEVIKSSVEDLVPIPSEFEGISDDTCDVPFCDNSPPLDVLNDHFEIFSDFNDDCTSSDDDSFEDVDYVEASPPDSELISLEEVKDDILREKLLNINLLIAKIESLNDNPTPDCVLKSPSLFPIPVEDINSFFEKSDTSLSYSDNSLPEFETFSYHTEKTSSGSTTTHADNSLPEYDSFLFEVEPDQG